MESTVGAELANWMSRLRRPESTRLTSLSIPGSHDSFTSNLDTALPVAPDQKDIVHTLSQIVPFIVKPVVKNWGMTQSMDCTQQLESGVRYFDIRLAKLKNWGQGSEIRVVHGLYGPELSSILSSLQTFLRSHSREVVILHFNHFYNMSHPKDFELVTELCKRNLDHVGICPPSERMPTIAELWARKQQVLLVGSQFSPELFWPSTWVFNPWANTMSTDYLDKFLMRQLRNRNGNDTLNVSQAILTPDSGYIVSHVFSSLYSSLAKKCNNNIRDIWLKDLEREKLKPNIIMVDFVEQLASTVVLFNQL